MTNGNEAPNPDPSPLPAGQRYGFMLQVTNFFGEVSTMAEKMITKSTALIPRLLALPS